LPNKHKLQPLFYVLVHLLSIPLMLTHHSSDVDPRPGKRDNCKNFYEDLNILEGHKAVVRIARKLLRRMRAVLLSQKMYVKGVTGNVTAKKTDAPALPAAKAKGRPKKAPAPAAGHHVTA
jgi:hypothetical protein